MSTSLASRPSRFRVRSDTVFEAVHTIAQLAKDVADIANVPFASQVVSLVLSMLEIAKVSRFIFSCIFLQPNLQSGSAGQ